MKKNMFFATLLFALMAFHSQVHGQQCANPSICVNLTFTPAPTSPISPQTFDLDCNNNSIVADFGLSGAGNISYTWYNTDGISVSSTETLAAPAPGNYILEIDYTIAGSSVCCAQDIIVNEWGTIPVEIFAPVDTCQEETFFVSATSNTNWTYTWTVDGIVTSDTDANTPVNTMTSSSVDVTVRVVDGGGCAGFASTTITVHEPPIVTAQANNTSICEGDNVIISVDVPPPSSTYDYMWSTGQTDNDFLDTPTSSTNYQVIVTAPNGCVAQSSVNVQVTPTPDATISTSNETICFGQNAILNAPIGMDSYFWTPTGETTQSITVTPDETMDYIVEVTKDDCTNMDTITLMVIPQGNINIIGDDEVCTGNMITLTAPAADSYLWSPGGQMTQIINVSPTENTTYTVTITASGCSSTGSKLVTVNPSPTATITGDTEICEGESTTLTAGGGGSYIWSTTETTQSIMVSPVSSQSYTVTVTSANDCTDTETRTVTVTSVNLSISGNTTICEGESTTLTASGGGTYLWSTGESTPSITVNPTATTTYSVTKTVNDCSLSDDVTVNVYPTYEMDISETICPGNSYTIGGNDYTMSGDYTITLNTFKGCDSIINLSLTVQPIPSYQFLQDSLFGNICSAQAITVDIQDELYEFTWRAPDNDNVIPGDECTALNIQDDPTTFFLDVSANGCTETNTFNINLSALATDAKVFRFADTKTLFCNRNDFVTYQWGKEHKDTLCDQIMEGETFQDVAVQDLDLDEYYYWVMVSDSMGCTNKIYLEGENNAPFGKLTQDPNIEYGDLALQINPNPNKGAFELTITGDEVRILDVHVYDALGRAIYHQKAPKIDGIHTHYVAVPNLTQGVYFVRVTGNDGILLTEKMIVK